MRKTIQKIKNDYHLDSYAALLFLLVSFSFPMTFKITIPLFILASLFQVFRFLKNKVTQESFFQTYFFLLVYSTIFFRSIHTIILIILLLFFVILFFKNKTQTAQNKYTTEIIILLFFGLIFLNQLAFLPRLKGLEKYLYILFYPLLFICIKKQSLKVPQFKSMCVFITSVLVASLLLIIANLYNLKIEISTNTFFAEYLDFTHVYYGMFLGVATIFLFIIFIKNNKYASKYIDIVLFVFFLMLLTYIGARTALLALLFVLIITLYRKIPLKWYKKSLLLLALFIGLLLLSYKTIPRAKSGIDDIKKVYISIKTKNKQDLINNSWRNMYQRFLVTDYTVKEIKRHLFFGIGLQNVKKKIGNQTLNDGYKYFRPINPHNQYLHIWLAMGLFSFSFFLIMLIFFLRAHAYSFYFLSFFLMIMLTESILVRVKGISLFFLFSLIFSLKEKYIYD